MHENAIGSIAARSRADWHGKRECLPMIWVAAPIPSFGLYPGVEKLPLAP
jgi:hypothetical protein